MPSGQGEGLRPAVGEQPHGRLEHRSRELKGERDQPDLAEVQVVRIFQNGIAGLDERLDEVVQHMGEADGDEDAEYGRFRRMLHYRRRFRAAPERRLRWMLSQSDPVLDARRAGWPSPSPFTPRKMATPRRCPPLVHGTDGLQLDFAIQRSRASSSSALAPTQRAPSGPFFALPERGAGLQEVHDELGRLERRPAVGRGGDHQHDGVAGLKRAMSDARSAWPAAASGRRLRRSMRSSSLSVMPG